MQLSTNYTRRYDVSQIVRVRFRDNRRVKGIDGSFVTHPLFVGYLIISSVPLANCVKKLNQFDSVFHSTRFFPRSITINLLSRIASNLTTGRAT